MGLTTIFLITMLAGIVLTALFGVGAGITAEDDGPMVLPVISLVLSGLCAVAVVVSLIGAIWSYNINHRDTINRCVESGGYIHTVNGTKYCLDQPPAIKWKM